MDAMTSGFIGSIIGTIVGASASILTTIISNKNSLKIQSQIEKHNSKQIFKEFQKLNFLEVQERMSKQLRLLGKIYIEDSKNFKKTNNWRGTSLESMLDNDLANSFREFTILIERVDDSQIRKELKAFNELMGSSLFSKSKIENETKLNKLRKDYTHLMDKIGIALRSNF